MKKRALRKERTLNLWQVVEGVLGHAVVPDLKVTVVAGGVAGGTDPGNLLALVDMIAHRYQQAAVMAAAADTQKFNADLSETAENKVLEELRSSGCNVVDVDDKTPWQEACAKVIKDNTSDQAELYQKLLDMKA